MRYLKDLCLLGGTSGDEGAVREYIISHLGAHPYTVDALGNIIVEKKGAATPKQKIMLSAHMDEVGMIITHIGDDGFFRCGHGRLGGQEGGKKGAEDGKEGTFHVHAFSNRTQAQPSRSRSDTYRRPLASASCRMAGMSSA